MTLNFLRQSTLNPKISAYESLEGPFNYDPTPLGPLGFHVITHLKPDARNSWDFRGEDGWSIGVLLEHYRCQRIAPKAAHCVKVTNTVDFWHQDITQPTVMPANHIQHELTSLINALTDSPNATSDPS